VNQRQESDAHDSSHMMDMRCVLGHGCHTQGMFEVVVLSICLRHDASSASSLMFYALVLP